MNPFPWFVQIVTWVCALLLVLFSVEHGTFTTLTLAGAVGLIALGTAFKLVWNIFHI
jgi:hypothetical protein